MESSGPEGGKVRGPAAMIHERYLQLARDAASSGDRVLSENYMQHADHYFRLWRSTQPATPPPQQMNDRFEDGEGDEDAGADVEGGEEGEIAADGGDQPDVEFPQGDRQQGDRDGDRGRNRSRGRRNRYRPNEGEGGEGREPREAREGGEREGGEERGERREAREDRGERREPRERRPPREPRDENAGPEGFSSGPKPAFLRGSD
jgi:hypothetical protein